MVIGKWGVQDITTYHDDTKKYKSYADFILTKAACKLIHPGKTLENKEAHGEYQGKTTCYQ